jgi:hypothetical protein
VSPAQCGSAGRGAAEAGTTAVAAVLFRTTAEDATLDSSPRPLEWGLRILGWSAAAVGASAAVAFSLLVQRMIWLRGLAPATVGLMLASGVPFWLSHSHPSPTTVPPLKTFVTPIFEVAFGYEGNLASRDPRGIGMLLGSHGLR